jgi:hypothetical protein
LQQRVTTAAAGPAAAAQTEGFGTLDAAAGLNHAVGWFPLGLEPCT